MSVLIRGMEIPRNCFECRFQDMEFCHAYHDHSGDAEYIPDDILDVSRPDWCPLIEVPTPLGGARIESDKDHDCSCFNRDLSEYSICYNCKYCIGAGDWGLFCSHKDISHKDMYHHLGKFNDYACERFERKQEGDK